MGDDDDASIAGSAADARLQTPERSRSRIYAEWAARWAEQGACPMSRCPDSTPDHTYVHTPYLGRYVCRCTGSTAGNVDACMQVCRYVYSVHITTMHMLDGKDITGLEIGNMTDQPSFESQLDAGRGLHMRPTRES